MVRPEVLKIALLSASPAAMRETPWAAPGFG